MNLHNVEQARFNMIEQQIRPWDVTDGQVLNLLSAVKREDFVPTAYRSMAFVDMAIPLAGGQTMLPPRMEGRLLQDAAIEPTDTVLEIGTGAGYLTALMAHQALRVITIEINAELAEMARSHLQKANLHNVEVRHADGSHGTHGGAPFDVIVLGGSVAVVPQSLLTQLKIGGRLVAVVGDEPIMHCQIITRTSETNFKTDEKWDDNAPRLLNFPQPSAFKF